jgi:ABC-type dipeptide/oligopeptide/nickel transport system ATPase component
MSDDSEPDSTEEITENINSEKQTENKVLRFADSGSQTLDFNFIAYEEKITIVGASGSGKSYLANEIMKSLHGVSVWVYDFNFQFHSSKAIVFNDLDKLLEVYDTAKRGHYILQPHDNSEETFKRFNAEAFKRGNLVLVEDEVHTWLSKQRVIKEFNQVILSGRPRGISVISISSRPASLPNNVLSNSKHVFAFKLNLESDIKFLEGFLGTDVWILMPKDKRHKLQEESELPDFTFFYRDMDTSQGRLGKI